MQLEARESGELVADFDNPVPVDKALVRSSAFFGIISRWGCLLVGFEKEAVFTIVYHGYVLVFGDLLGCELDMSKDPRL